MEAHCRTHRFAQFGHWRRHSPPGQRSLRRPDTLTNPTTLTPCPPSKTRLRFPLSLSALLSRRAGIEISPALNFLQSIPAVSICALSLAAIAQFLTLTTPYCCSSLHSSPQSFRRDGADDDDDSNNCRLIRFSFFSPLYQAFASTSVQTCLVRHAVRRRRPRPEPRRQAAPVERTSRRCAPCEPIRLVSPACISDTSFFSPQLHIVWFQPFSRARCRLPRGGRWACIGT